MTLTLGLGASKLSKQMIQVRKISEITQEELNDKFNDKNVDTGVTDLGTLVLQLNGALKRVYEKIVPPK